MGAMWSCAAFVRWVEPTAALPAAPRANFPFVNGEVVGIFTHISKRHRNGATPFGTIPIAVAPADFATSIALTTASYRTPAVPAT